MGQVAVRVRHATEADLHLCVDLARRHWGGEAHLVYRSLRRHIGDTARLLVIAEEADGHVVGHGRAMHHRPATEDPERMAPEGWYLLGLVVEPAHRRRGIGRALTAARLAWIADRADTAWYFANVRNTASWKLHAAFGFVEVTRDFSFPGLTFDDGPGTVALLRVDLKHALRQPEGGQRG